MPSTNSLPSTAFPLSAPQRDLWLDQALYPGEPLYNIGGYLRIEGALDAARFEAALRDVVAANEALRTVVRTRDGTPVQEVLAPPAEVLEVRDLRGESAPEAAALAWMEAALARPFELEGGRLASYALLRVGEDLHFWLMRYHHLVSDGGTIALVARRVAEAYGARSRGEARDASPAPTYREFVEEGAAYATSDRHARDREYWRARFADVPPGPLTGEGRTLGSATDRLRFDLPRDLFERVRARAREAGGTELAFLLAAIGTYLARLAGQPEVVAGLPMLNRRGRRARETCGLFTQVLPARFAVPRLATVDELVVAIARGLRRDYRHQRLALGDILRARDARTGDVRLFDWMLSYETQRYDLDFAGAPATIHRLTPGADPTPLTFAVGDYHAGEPVQVFMEWSRDLMDAGEAHALAARLQGLLEGMVALGEVRVGDLPLLLPADRAAVLPGSAAQDPGEDPVELFESAAARAGGEVAVVAGPAVLRYEALLVRSRRLAARLRRAGVGAESRVGVLLDRDEDLVIALVAVLGAGGAFVPLDPADPPARHARVLADAGVEVFLTRGEAPRGVLAVDPRDLDADPGAFPASPPLDAAAYVVYTSGSTGRPKGVVVSRRALANLATWAEREIQSPLGAGLRVAFTATAAFDAAVQQVFGALLAGHELRVIPDAVRRDAQRLTTALVEDRIDLVDLSPSQLRAMLDLDPDLGGWRGRGLIVGSEAFPAELLARLRAGPASRDLPVWNLYGPTETCVNAAAYRCEGAASGATVPVGTSAAGARLYVLGPDGELLPPGVPGELHVGGPGVARGYLDRPGLTAASFLPDPFADDPAGARMYRTGDRVRRLTDGTLEFLGRRDDQVKVRGHRVELGEVEAALRALPGVREAAVLARGEGGATRLVAFVAGEDAPGEGEVREALAARLPGPMVPGVVHRLPALPLAASGKVDRAALRRYSPTDASRGSEIEYDDPGVARLAALWRDLLGVARVAPGDSFFALGGHSLLATRLVSRVRAEFGVELPVREVFEAPGLEDLAARVAAAAPASEAPAPARGGGEEAPLSFNQERLWFLDRLDGPGATYNMPAVLRLRGPLDPDALDRALAALIDRHEVLRTTFPDRDGVPFQRVAPRVDFALAREDLGHLAAPARRRAAAARAEEEARRPFDLATGPLIRGALLRHREDDHTLLVTMHHAVSDGWSITLMVRELAAAYRAATRGEPPALPPLGRQYRDFAREQREWYASPAGAAELAFWEEELAGVPPVLALPTDRPRPARPSHRGGDERFLLGADLTARIERLARARGATTFMVLAAGVAALLGRLGATTDLCLGTPVAGRTRREDEDLVGFFVNTLALRIRLDGDPGFAELVDRVRDTSLRAFEHQRVPFERVVDAVLPARDLSHAPLFQVMLVLQNQGAVELELEGVELGLVERPSGVAKFDLSLQFQEDPVRGLEGILEYATDLFDAATARDLIDRLRVLFEAAVDRPSTPLAELPVLAPGEAERLEALAQGTVTSGFQEPNLPAAFEAQAARTPDAVAVEGGEDRRTYAELRDGARRLARHLGDLGVRAGDRVGVLLGASARQVEAALAAMMAGAAYVPVDPGYPAARIRTMAGDAGWSAVVTDGAGRELLGEHGAPVVDLDAVDLGALPAGPLGGDVHPRQAAYMIYTSGSTGTPKGAVVEHRSLLNLASWHARAYGIGPGTRGTLFASVGFDAAVCETWPALLAGACLVPVPEGIRRDPEALVAFWRERAIDVAFVPTRFCEEVVAAHGRDLLAGLVLYTGGEALAPAALPAGRLVNNYGPTEATVATTWIPVEAGHLGGVVPIGRPIDNVRVHVLDAALRPVPVGVAGDLYIGGVSVGRGYHRRPGATAAAFLPDPFAGDPGGARLYRTGDRARWRRDGSLEFLGRLDGQVKIRGHRIELGEIEAAIAALPGVERALAVVQRAAGRATRVLAYVVGEARASDLEAALRETLPGYMVPGAIVVLPGFPLTPHGKVDRAALPEPGAPEAPRGAPMTATEEALAALWREVLGVEVVGPDDDFFALGGDSILSVQIVSRARAAGMVLRVRDFFESSRLGDLALRVREPALRELGHAVPVDSAALTPIQRWFLETAPAHDGDPRHYDQAVYLEVDPDVDADRLGASLAALVAHHPALRTRFGKDARGWVPRVGAPEGALRFGVHELAGGDLRGAADALHREIDHEAGPAMVAALFRRPGGEPGILLLAAHHLVVDGVSWRILLEDLARAYRQLAAGDPVVLPPVTSSPEEFARRLEGWACGGVSPAERAGWERRTGTPPALVAGLPADPGRLEEEVKTSRRLGSEETAALLGEAPRAYRTRIDDLLLSALARCVGGADPGEPVRVDVEGHGREDLFDDVDLSRTVGWFTAVYPARIPAGGAGDPGATVVAVKEELRGIPRGGIGHGVLRWLAPDASARAAVTPDRPAMVLFNNLGRFDAVTGESPLRGLAAVVGGASRDPARRREYAIEISTAVVGGRLGIGFIAGPGPGAPAALEAVADRYVGELRAILAHCTAAGFRAHTPSDFPLACMEPGVLAREVGEEVEDLYPLTPMQEGMLFHGLQAPGSGVYVEQPVLRLEGTLDPVAMRAAWDDLVDRHPILRVRFFWEGTRRPHQGVVRGARAPWREEDLSSLPPADAAARRATLLEEARRGALDLARAPLMDLLLLRHGPRSHELVWTHHHALLDGWSGTLVVRDLVDLYRARAAGEVPRLGPAPRPFRELVRWQLARDPREDREFWRRELEGVTGPTRIVPTGEGEGSGQQVEATLPAARSRQVEALARREGLTPAILLQGAWALLLARRSGEEEVLFGVTMSGRPGELPGVEEMVGPFLNTVPLRVRLRDDRVVGDWLRDLRRAHARREAHQATPLYEIQGLCGLGGAAQLFESILVFENFPLTDDDLPFAEDLRIAGYDIAEQTNYPLALTVLPGEEFRFALGYDGARLGADQAAGILRELDEILGELVERPGARLGELRGISGEARRHVTEVLARSEHPAALPETLHALFAAQAARTPDAVALVAGEGRVTYAALAARAARLAHRLVELGVGVEDRVGVLLPRGPEMVVALLATLQAGGAFVALDPGYPRTRLALQLEDAAPAVLIGGPGMAAELCPEGTVLFDPGVEDLAGYPPTPPAVRVRPENAAYVVFTSGSTGRPRGVVGLHAGMANRFRWMYREFPFLPGEVACQKTSPAFVDVIWEVLGPLAAGVPLVLLDGDAARDPAALLATLREERVSRIVLVPSLLRALLDRVETGDPAPEDLRICTSSGEALDPALAARFHALLPGRTLLNIYGSSEVSADCAAQVVAPDAGDAAVPLGRPIDGTRLYVLDSGLRPVPVGVVGELHVGGAGLARGYLHDAARTAARFVPDPFGDDPAGARLYRTGDRARWMEDGTLAFEGRVDHQVKIRGHRVELGEVEAALLAHPEIQAAAVVVREDPTRGAALAAYVVAGAAGLPRDLRDHLRGRLPEAMLPASFAALDALPLTPSGKLDRRALPGEVPGAEAGAGSPPTTPTEVRLAALWGEVLGVPGVGAGDRFFDLGGHSLLATRLVSRVREAFGVELGLREVFEHPGLADMARAVDARAGEVAAEEVPLGGPRPDPAPLSFGEERHWVLARLGGEIEAHAVPMVYRVAGPLDQARLGDALAAVVARHEILRTRYVEDGGHPRRVIDPPGEVALEARDLAELPDAAADARVAEEVRRQAEEPFDLARGPLLRAALFRRGPAAHDLVLTLHHGITDGWSIDLLVAELKQAYRGVLDPAVPGLQYADFAAWQRRWFSGARRARALDFWRTELRGAPARLELPTDRPRPARPDTRAAAVAIELEPARVDALREFSRRRGASLFMTLAAGLAAFLGRLAGQDDVCLGTPVAGRTRRELEGMQGFFVNTLVLRARMDGDPTVDEWVERFRDRVLAAYAHQDAPFEQVVDACLPARDAGHAPLFQVLLVLHNQADPGPPGGDDTDLVLEARDVPPVATPFDLAFNLREDPDGAIRGRVEYPVALFESVSVTRMVGLLGEFLGGMAARPEARLGELELVGAAARRVLLEEFAHGEEAAAAADPGGRDEVAGGRGAAAGAKDLLHRLLAARAARDPEAVAVRHGTRVLRYGELAARARDLAARLAARGVGPEDVVGVLFDPSADFAVAAAGVLEAGAAYLPLDPGYPPARLGWMVEDAGARVVVGPPGGTAPGGATLLELDLDGTPASGDVDPVRPVHPEGAAYVIYTSGSTGRPKGVVVSHRAAANLCRWHAAAYGVGPGTRATLFASVGFDAAVAELWPYLLAGACLHPVPEAARRDPACLLEFWRDADIDVAWVPTATCRLLDDLGLRPPAGMRLLTAGEALGRAPDLGVPVANNYGPTEAAVCTTWAELGREPEGRVAPIGRPIPGARTYVLDPAWNPVPVGVPGELAIAGVGLARGYLGRPGLTAGRFVPDPFGGEEGGRLYLTGDRVRWRVDGQLEFLGRIDEQVKVRGHRVEPGEVAHALEEHPAVRTAIVQAWDAAPFAGELVAHVEVGAGAAPSPADLRRHLAGHLPAFMVPAAIRVLAAFPRTSAGKVDRAALPPPVVPAAARALPPRDAVERGLAAAWEEVLGAPPASAAQGFFDAGGNSLLAVRFLAAAREHLGHELPLARFLEAPSIEALAAATREPSPGTPPLVTLRPGEDGVAPAFLVGGAGGRIAYLWWLARSLAAGRPVHALSPRGVDGREDPFASVEEQAAAWLPRVEEHLVPGTSPLLVGHSFGARHAFELARLLRSRGHEARLVVLDGGAPAEGDVPGELDDRALAAEVVAAASELLGEEAPGFPEELAGEEVPARLHAALVDAGFLPAGSPEAETRGLLGVFRSQVESRYRPEPAARPLRTMVVRAGGEPAARPRDLGWAPYVGGEPVLEEVAADHLAMVAAPHAPALGALIERFAASSPAGALAREPA